MKSKFQPSSVETLEEATIGVVETDELVSADGTEEVLVLVPADDVDVEVASSLTIGVAVKIKVPFEDNYSLLIRIELQT